MSRITLDLTSAANSELERLAETQGTTKAEILRKALATYKYLSDETSNSKSGQKVAITGPDGKVRKEIIIR